VVHFAVTAHPTAEWTAQQLIAAFPSEPSFDTESRGLLKYYELEQPECRRMNFDRTASAIVLMIRTSE
jgi:hypothetical protein